jgi:hypothetical protein
MQPDDSTTDPAVTAMLSRWRDTIDPTVATPAVLEAAAIPPHATSIERSEAAGAVAACFALRQLDRLDLAIEMARHADEHSAKVGQVLLARELEPARIQQLQADAWLWCTYGFMRRVQRSMIDLAAGRSLVDQGIVVLP